jgi:hypothetical protein
MEGKPPAEPSPKEILPVEDLVSLQRISLQRLSVFFSLHGKEKMLTRTGPTGKQ